MSNKTPKVENKGAGLFLVDPNPPGSGVLPAEDMFIYVKFTATERSRGVVTLTDSDSSINESRDGEINFIASEVKYDASGEPLKNLMGKTESYATTNYTDIGGVKNSYSSGSLEGFGIKNISIKYNASLVPQVDISFTDVRGSALFDVIEQDNRKSPYSLFFKMPYPIFNLTVKGYFGNPVEYCLHMVNWTSKFDPGTGNFDITANFLGFQQAFLADMTIGNVIGVNNTDLGKEALANLPMKAQDPVYPDKMIDIGPTPSLDSFIKKISKLQVDLEFLKSNDDTYKKLIILNTQKKKLKRIQSFIGAPIPKDVGNPTTKTPYSEIPNDKDVIVTSEIQGEGSLILNQEYLSIRDYLIFKYSSIVSVNYYMKTLYDLLKDYQKFKVVNYKQLKTGIVDGIIIDGDTIINETIFPISEGDGEIIDYLTGLEVSTAGGTLSTKTAGKGYPSFPTTLIGAIDGLKQPSPISSQFQSPSSLNGEFQNGDVDISQFVRPTSAKSQFLSKDPVFVLDFRKMRSEVKRMIIDIDKQIKEDTKSVNVKINEELKKSIGYNPTVKTVFEILCNNVQSLVDVTYKVAMQAEGQTKERAKELKKNVLDTDIDTDESGDFKNSTIYAFPKIIQISDTGEAQEKYVGSKDLNLTTNSFPEIKFIEDVAKGITKSSSELRTIRKQTSKLKQQGFDTNSWVPNNPIDVANDNPFLFINSLSSESVGVDELIKQFYNILLTRYAVCKNYSKMPETQLSAFGIFDAIDAKKSIFESTIRKVLSEKLSTSGSDAIISNGITSGYVIEQSNIPIINESGDDLPKLGDIEISGFRNDDVEYIEIEDNSGKIIDSKSALWKEVKNKNKYENIFGETVQTGFDKTIGSYTQYLNHLVFVNASYDVWGVKVNKKLKKGQTANNKFSIKDNDITRIDGGQPPPEGSTNNVDTPIKTDYINVLSAGSSSDGGQQVEIPRYLTTVSPSSNLPEESSILYNNPHPGGNKSKALLLLNTLPFVPFQHVIDNYINKTHNGKYLDIIRLPKYYLLFIAGTLWRATESSDPIDWSNSEVDSVTINQYLSTIGVNKSYGGTPTISASLTSLPTKTKETLIEFFIQWVTNEFETFESQVVGYTTEEDITAKYQKGEKIAYKLSENINLIINAIDIFTPNALDSGLSLDGFATYYNSFVDNFTKEEDSTEEKDPAVIEKEDTQLEPIKLQMYNYFKNIYDKWIAGSPQDQLSYNACGEAGKNLIDYFKFINRGFNDIGNKAVINLDSVATLSENMDTNFYFYISKILRDSNFLFQIMPSYINFKDEEEMKDIFRPVTDISQRNSSSGPTYLCIYAGGTSEVLDLNEKSRYTYKNDGFSFQNPPPDMESTGGEEDFNLVAFRVAYGAENQTMFKSVSLNQQEHRETAEYFAALTDLIDKRGGTQRSYQGTDLYKIFKTRSYKAEVESLGCMSLQPMMYFQLDNVPFFNGAYMVLNVSHTITPNHMVTTFSGLRQSKILSPPVEEITTFLDSDLTETIEEDTEFVFQNQNNPDKYNVGVDTDKEPDTPFDLVQINKNSLIDMGVLETNASDLGIILQSQFAAGTDPVISKSQVTMLLANMLTMSSDANGHGFSHIVESWPEIDSPTRQQQSYYDKENKLGNPSTDDDNPYIIQSINPIKYSLLQVQTIAHKYRKRGYIPIVGLDEYKEASYVLGVDLVTNPDLINEDKLLAVRVSLFKWKLGICSPFSYSKGGSANNFTKTVAILSGEKGGTIGKSFDNFARVLSRFDLIGINIEGTTSDCNSDTSSQVAPDTSIVGN